MLSFHLWVNGSRKDGRYSTSFLNEPVHGWPNASIILLRKLPLAYALSLPLWHSWMQKQHMHVCICIVTCLRRPCNYCRVANMSEQNADEFMCRLGPWKRRKCVTPRIASKCACVFSPRCWYWWWWKWCCWEDELSCTIHVLLWTTCWSSCLSV
jgi:hypothetical protein